MMYKLSGREEVLHPLTWPVNYGTREKRGHHDSEAVTCCCCLFNEAHSGKKRGRTCNLVFGRSLENTHMYADKKPKWGAKKTNKW